MAKSRSISASPPRSFRFASGPGSGSSTNPVHPARKRGKSARLSPLPGWKIGSDSDSIAARLRSRLRDWLTERRQAARGWLASLVLHAFVLLIMGLTIWFPVGRAAPPVDVVAGELEPGSELGFPDGFDLVGMGIAAPQGDPFEKWNAIVADMAGAGDADSRDFPHARIDAFATRGSDEADDDDDEPEAQPANNSKGPAKAARAGQRGPARGTGKDVGANVAGLLDGRGEQARARLAKRGGGTKESERAVELGLDWLARHQRSDGSWSFQHGPDDPGLLDCPTGATGLALMAFLGAGNTHQKGRYRYQVARGLKYLVEHLEETDKGGWFQGTGQATMYVQGIDTIALCEAYAMSKDQSLRRPAQLAVDFIVNAQDREGGGWRYMIPQAGDTSVVGWQVMALTSARIAELTVHRRVLPKVAGFLQRVQGDGGGMYGYTDPGKLRPSTTAAGLLCRMYLGREQTNRGLIRGMNNLATWGPNGFDMYYSYYGTMAMHHWGGPSWERWNDTMRKILVDSQEQEGDAAGSWITDRSKGADMGGRLYTTCLSILTLEVYYRYLPLYRKLPDVSEEEIQATEVAAQVERTDG